MWDCAKDKDSGVVTEQVREIFDYNPEEGYLRWKIARQRIIKGSIAGFINKSDGYRYVCFDGHTFLVHRVIWLWVTGEWPKCQVDHDDRDRDNNKWTNLREVNNSQNMRNAGASANSVTGIRGVDIRRGKYRVRIFVDGNEVVVGRFLTLEEAKQARFAAERFYWDKLPVRTKQKSKLRKPLYDQSTLDQIAYDLHLDHKLKASDIHYDEDTLKQMAYDLHLDEE